MPQGIAQLRGPVRALFTDMDGTLTTEGRLDLATLASLFQLWEAKIPVVLVTGRPAGWGHALANLFPFAAVVTENGGVSFVPQKAGFRTLYGLCVTELPQWRIRMEAAAQRVFRRVPEACLSTDSSYREVDLAIDWNEEIHLPIDVADSITEELRSGGFAASRSSVHVNYSPPGFDKFTASKRICHEVFDAEPGQGFFYVGDSLNDAPMFASFANAVGVANVKEGWDDLPHKPSYITPSAEGRGFEELAARLLELQAQNL